MASAALGESLDYTRTLCRVAQLSVSWLSDACVVYTLEGDEVRRTASATANPAQQPLLNQAGQRLVESGSLRRFPPSTTAAWVSAFTS